ncbi:MAG: hypothetical protein HKL90_06430 [Elusimicrobia bacterium]|nr:hypothetical protein [Elusimicrobiota bacterium]
MKQFNRGACVGHAVGWGLSVLLLSPMIGRARGAEAQNEASSGAPTAGVMIRKWPQAARVAAAAMIEKYGEPIYVTEGVLVWINNGPWRKTVVYQPEFLGKRSRDFIEQTIAYRVPFEEIRAVKRFDPRIKVNALRGQLSIRTSSESSNFLAMNLADEVIEGRRGAQEARAFRRKTVELSKAGKSSSYMDRLLFPDRGGAMSFGLFDPADYNWNTLP